MNVEVVHCEMSDPAFEVVGAASYVTTTSSVAEQAPFVTVHRSVALVPCARPVTVEVLKAGVVIEAVPENNDHTPLPVVGAVAPRVKLPVQLFISVPAFTGVGVE